MKFIFFEHDLVDSVCTYTAAQEYTKKKDINMDLTFHPSFGFKATANMNGKIRYFSEQDLIQAVTGYLKEFQHVHSDNFLVDLQFAEKEGISACVQINDI